MSDRRPPSDGKPARNLSKADLIRSHHRKNPAPRAPQPNPSDVARERVNKIRSMALTLSSLLVESYRARDWLALGYKSWDAMCRAEFGRRISLPPEDRDDVVAELREGGLSLRAIGSAIGESKDTVARSLPGVSNETPGDDDAKIIGIDGKRYRREHEPSKTDPLSTRVPLDPHEAESALAALATAMILERLNVDIDALEARGPLTDDERRSLRHYIERLILLADPPSGAASS